MALHQATHDGTAYRSERFLSPSRLQIKRISREMASATVSDGCAHPRVRASGAIYRLMLGDQPPHLGRMAPKPFDDLRGVALSAPNVEANPVDRLIDRLPVGGCKVLRSIAFEDRDQRGITAVLR